MKQASMAFLRSVLRSYDVEILRYSTLQKLEERIAACDLELQLLHSLPGEHSASLLEYIHRSKSQLYQDLFALAEVGFKTNGYFVEFGATDGIGHSNTYLMEKCFGWSGILAEPAIRWHEDLISNRKAHIETCCVWSHSNKTLEFKEVDSPDLSTIDAFSLLGADQHRQARNRGRVYEVRTISLNDLLDKHHAPREIDYLSIDTEGSEFEILNHFDFGRHSFKVITCEHNFSASREKIYDLLRRNGYVRKYEQLSKWDDWYVQSD